MWSLERKVARRPAGAGGARALCAILGACLLAGTAEGFSAGVGGVGLNKVPTRSHHHLLTRAQAPAGVRLPTAPIRARALGRVDPCAAASIDQGLLDPARGSAGALGRFQGEGERAGSAAAAGPAQACFDVDGVPGLQLVARPSVCGLGLGLFLSVKEAWRKERVLVRAGTKLCTYCDVHRGAFREQSSGDRTVQYSFTDPLEDIMYGGNIMPLLQAMAGVKMPWRDALVAGHRVHVSAGDGQGIRIEPEGGKRNFVPGDNGEVSVDFLGTLANDMAYSPGCTQSEYESKSSRNVLAKRWVMEVHDGQLVPKSIIIVSSRDLEITSVEPQEAGLTYGWSYWEGTRYGDVRSKVTAAIGLSYGMAALAFAASHAHVF